MKEESTQTNHICKQQQNNNNNKKKKTNMNNTPPLPPAPPSPHSRKTVISHIFLPPRPTPHSPSTFGWPACNAVSGGHNRQQILPRLYAVYGGSSFAEPPHMHTNTTVRHDTNLPGKKIQSAQPKKKKTITEDFSQKKTEKYPLLKQTKAVPEKKSSSSRSRSPKAGEGTPLVSRLVALTDTLSQSRPKPCPLPSPSNPPPPPPPSSRAATKQRPATKKSQQKKYYQSMGLHTPTTTSTSTHFLLQESTTTYLQKKVLISSDTAVCSACCPPAPPPLTPPHSFPHPYRGYGGWPSLCERDQSPITSALLFPLLPDAIIPLSHLSPSHSPAPHLTSVFVRVRIGAPPAFGALFFSCPPPLSLFS
eukprot:Rhum_TRINITY_DN15092_c1_g1::Rhum_TRINITY_DN15092_c1_g1_i1::g.137618::m.137618